MWAKVEQWRQEQLEAGGTALSSHNAVEFVDIGSGVGGVRLMAALMAGAEATGVGLSFECHNAARKWHLTCARAIPAMSTALTQQADRLLHGDVLPLNATIAVIATADVIFINNLLFSEITHGTSLNASLAELLQAHAKETSCIVTTTPLTTVLSLATDTAEGKAKGRFLNNTASFSSQRTQ